MIPRRILLPLIMTTLFTSLFATIARAGYESPEHTVVSKEGSFEIRDYPALTLAVTPMEKRGEDGSFMKLFRFIGGRNDRGEKIAMTVPVVMTGTTSGSMGFIVPKKVAEAGVPTPSSPDVTITRRDAGRYAVLRFSGTGSPAASREAAERLASWMEKQGVTPGGPPLYAYYNPPWTPWFLRHNEVLVPVAPPAP